jgi:peptidoglycan/LPS O-acetylase OafA/YrhL
MQFYLCFPLLFFALRKVPPIAAVLTAAACVGLSSHLIGVYVVDPGKLISFPQPSILGLRLNCFVAGMLLAKICVARRVGAVDFVALCISVALFQRSTFAVLAFVVALIVLRDLLPVERVWLPVVKLIDALADFLGNRFGRTLGDLSYSIYLLHIFLLIPIVTLLQSTGWFFGLSGVFRFLLVVVIVLPLVVILSKVTFRLVEQPLIAAGRRFAK